MRPLGPLALALAAALALAGPARAQQPAPPPGGEPPAAPPAGEAPTPAPPPVSALQTGILERTALEAEAARLDAAMKKEGVSEDDRKRLEAELQLVRRALQTIALKAKVEADKTSVKERRTRAEEAAKTLAKEAVQPLEPPSPFTKDLLDKARERERDLKARLDAARQEIQALSELPDRYRADLKKLEESLEPRKAERARAAEKEGGANEDERPALRRQLALLDLSLQEMALRREVLSALVDIAQNELPVRQLERDNLKLELERSQRRVELYQKLEEKRLADERAAAEREAQRKAEELERLKKRRGFEFKVVRTQAEELLGKEEVQLKQAQSKLLGWSQRVRDLRNEADALTQRANVEIEKLERPQTEAGMALRLGALRILKSEWTDFHKRSLLPAAADAKARRRELLATLERIRSSRQALDVWYRDERDRARGIFERLRPEAPGFYTEERWQEEATLWSELRTKRANLLSDFERALTEEEGHLLELLELEALQSERLTALETRVRKSSFWLRSDPIIDMDTLTPALSRLSEGWSIFAQSVKGGSAWTHTLGFLGRPLRLAQVLGLVIALVLLVLGSRRFRTLLEPRLHAEVSRPIPRPVRVQRALLRIFDLVSYAVPFAVTALAIWLLFMGAGSRFVLSLTLIALAHLTVHGFLRGGIRPHEDDWRLVPLPNDLAVLAFRFLERVLLVTTTYLVLWAVARLLGDDLYVELRDVLRLVYGLVLTLLVLLTAVSPTVSRRILSVISPRLAERLRLLIAPFALFVSGTVIAIFTLRALGYQNAAASVRGSLLQSLAMLGLGVALERLLYLFVVSRLDPQGVEDTPADGSEELDEHDPGSPKARRLFVHELAGAIVSLAVLVAVGSAVVLSFEVEATTLRAVLDYSLFQPSGDRPPLVIGDLVGFVLTIVATIYIYRYFRGFTACFVLPRTGLSRGARFAVSTVAGYIIVGFGGVIALRQLHLYVGDFEWFLAAAGVGIGFGLQEILSNFVSGLIILIERPIEVGDIVTVNGVQGEIERITIRATTVNTSDNITIIVPNKEFIVASVTNWSHGSPEVRIRIPVGVAYGSNVQLVKQTLLEAAEGYGRVMKKPAPGVAFIGFGASSLDFELAVWVSSPDPRFHRQVKTDLCSMIDAAFRRMAIEIPFTQVDLHIREGETLKVLPVDPKVSAEQKEEEEREAMRKKALEKRKSKVMRAMPG